MANPVTQRLELDLRGALAQLDVLERQINDLREPVRLDLDVSGDAAQEIRTIDDRLDDIVTGTQAVNRELGDMEDAASRSVGDFSRLSSEMGTAESHAAGLAGEIGQADRAAGRLDTEAGEAAGALNRAERAAAGLVTELRQADRAASDINVSAGRLGGISGVFTGAAVGIAAAGTALALGLRGANDAIQSFATLEDSINAVNVIFGTAAKSVLAFGDQAAESAGLSETAFNQAVVPIGALLQNFGFDAKEAGDAAVILVQRAADLASVVGGDVPTALAALSSALRGEADPLEAYGASISAARVQQFALAEGLASTAAEITPAITLQARYGLILADTAKVAGDYAATADDLANAQRTAGAKAQEFATDIGEALAPAMEGLLGLVDPLLEGLRQLVPGFANAAGSAGEFFTEIGEGDTHFRETFSTTGAAFGILGESFAIFGDQVQTVLGAVVLDTEAVDAQLEQIEERNARIKVKGLGVQLAKDLDAGTKPVTAFALALNQVALQTENVGAFGTAFRNFATQANLSKEDLIEVTRAMLDNAEAAGLSQDEIAFLNQQYALLTDAIFPSIEAVREFNRVQREAPDLPPIFADTTRFTTFATDTETAAAAAEQSLTDLATAAAEQAQNTADAFNLFDELPDKIRGSFTEAVETLREQAEAIAQFDINLAILEALDLDALAADFKEKGIAAADQLAEAVNDIPLAIEADQLLQGVGIIGEEAFQALVDKFVSVGMDPTDARRLAESLKIATPQVIAAAEEAGVEIGTRTAIGTMTSYREALIEEGQQMDTALIEEAIGARVEESFTADDQAEFAATATVEAWNEEAIRTAEGLDGSELQSRLGDLFSGVTFDISADQFNFPDSGAFQGTIGVGAVFTGTGGGSTVNVTNNIYNPTTNDLPTNVAQANQSTAAVGTALNRVVNS